jgi:uncharacterized Zn-binding protein involved in type VI secretion
MPKPAAKKLDSISAVDLHLVQGVPTPFPFEGVLMHDLVPTVLFENQPAARVGSRAANVPSHVPPPGKSFDRAPKNEGGVARTFGKNVLVDSWPVARHRDLAKTCNDVEAANGTVNAAGSVLVGDG